MSRQLIRASKRALAAGGRSGAAAHEIALSKEAALHLLNRSIQFGHARLAVLRLAIAVQAGANVQAEHWGYCRGAARDAVLQGLLRQAEEALAARTGASGAMKLERHEA